MSWLDDFLNQQHHLKETRKEVYRISVKNFRGYAGADFKTVYMDVKAVHAALNVMGERVQDSTWNKQIVVYKRLARWLSDLEDDVCPKLWRKIKQKKIDWEAKLKYKWLTEMEFSDLLNNVDVACHKALFATCVAGGLRAGEVLGLRRCDVAAEGSELRVTVTGKTGTRSFPMNQFAPILKHWLNFHPQKNNSDAGLWPRSIDGVKSKSDNLSKAHVNRLLKKYCKRAGIAKAVSLHWLRHTKVTWTAKNRKVKSSDKEVNLAYGWAPNSTMYRRYAHLFGSDTDDLFRALDGVEVEAKPEEIKVLQRKTCFNCNEQNDAGALYCFRCGSVLDAEEARKHGATLEDMKADLMRLVDERLRLLREEQGKK